MSKPSKVSLEKIHQAVGNFSKKPLFERKNSSKLLLEDQDINQLMPKSQSNLEVLAACGSDSIDAIKEGISLALINQNISHIFIPFAKNTHWRGITITKNVDKSLLVEIFDSFGKRSANRMIQEVEKLLPNTVVDIKFIEPRIIQKDGHSCGDYTVAYFHCRMKELKIAGFDSTLAVTFNNGNQNNALRNYVLTMAETLNADRIKNLKKIVSAKDVSKDKPTTYQEELNQIIQDALSQQGMFAVNKMLSKDEALAVKLQKQALHKAGYLK